MKNEILWISLCAPYDRVAHGGGKTHNYYLKKIQASEKFNIKLISFCELDEYEEIKEDLDKYGIDNVIIPWNHNFNIANLKRKLQLINSFYNPFNKFGGATNNYYLDCINKVVKSGEYNPQIIILQWTEIVLFCTKIKKLFPHTKIIAIEEDVKFLAYKRKINLATSKIKKIIERKKYESLRKEELYSLSLADKVITYNNKDKILLNDGGIRNVIVISPYFEDYNFCKRSGLINKDIIFYGAMSRQDNYESAIWFINNVFNKITDKSVRFVVVGNKPVKKLKDYASDRIIITGFVESVAPFFQSSLCLVAPLISGAGIKIKILEALSAGIPVITNDIGIEGINAVNQRDYIHCSSGEDYLQIISKIINKQIDVAQYSKNSQKMICDNYNLEEDADRVIALFENIIDI